MDTMSSSSLDQVEVSLSSDEDEIAIEKLALRRGRPHDMPESLVSAGLFAAVSYVTLNEGAVRAASYSASAEDASYLVGGSAPNYVALVAALAEVSVGLSGLVIAVAVLVYNCAPKRLLRIWLELALIFGTLSSLVFGAILPILDMISDRDPPTGLSIQGYDSLRCMGLLGGLLWCFALQGGQYMLGQNLSCILAEKSGKVQTKWNPKKILLVWSTTAALHGLAFIVGGSIAAHVFGGGSTELSEEYSPLPFSYPGLTITAGLVTVTYGCVGMYSAIRKASFDVVRLFSLLVWIINLVTVAWIPSFVVGSAMSTSLLTGSCTVVFFNVAHAWNRFDLCVLEEENEERARGNAAGSA